VSDEEEAVRGSSTEYVVLTLERFLAVNTDAAQGEEYVNVEAWKPQPGVVQGPSQEQVLNAAKDAYPESLGVAAVPFRSWKPQRIESKWVVKLTPIEHPGADVLPIP
jgi:hypothetical protein